MRGSARALLSVCRTGLLVLLALPGAAAGVPETYLQGGFLWHDEVDDTDGVPNRGDSQLGYRAVLQLALPPQPVAWFTEYDNTDQLERFSIGPVYERPLAMGLDALAGAFVEFEDMTDEKGYGLIAGLLWRPVPRLTVKPEVWHVELFDADTSLRLTAITRLAGRLHGEAAAQVGDDERYVLGMRYVLPSGRGMERWLER